MLDIFCAAEPRGVTDSPEYRADQVALRGRRTDSF
jgi:hypothetical protein